MNITYKNLVIKNKINPSSYVRKEINISKNNDFEKILRTIEKRSSRLKFSKHAIERIESRNIKLNKEDLKNIENAVDKAESKGVKEALILLKNTAFIVSVRNKTVITTATQEQLKENVFTNIDGAVII